jgi:hypothetical protein
MNTMQKIDKGIPIPDEVWERRKPRIYPWLEMEVGDSFIIETPFYKSARTSAWYASRRYGVKFRARRVDNDQYRIWRIE